MSRLCRASRALTHARAETRKLSDETRKKGALFSERKTKLSTSGTIAVQDIRRSPKLPDYFKGENEGPYNQRVVELDSSFELLLDKKTVYYGGGGSQIELCDILCKDGTFIHVKRNHGSSSLSHLFNQGLVSTRLIKSDTSFRKCAQGVIDEIEPNSFDLEKDSVKQVVFAIISKCDDARPVIPFFSKVALDAVRTQLAAMDVDVALARIKEIRTDCG